MIITAGLVGLGATYTAYRVSNKEEIKKNKKLKKDKTDFINKWNLIMKYSNIKNTNEQTFGVLEYIPKESYGCDAIIGIPYGLNYSDLFKLIPTLENNYGTLIFPTLSLDGNSIYIRVAYNLNDAKKEDIIRFKWYKTMQSDIRFMNKQNITFTLKEIKIHEKFGFDLKVLIPNGLSYDDLLKAKSMLENIYKAQIIICWGSYNNLAKIRVIDVKDNELPFVYHMELKWYKMLSSLSNPNNYINDNYETFKINRIIKQDIYGFDCEVIIPTGISYDKLESIKNVIESTYKAHVYMEEDKFNGKALLKIITKPIDDNIKFEIVKTKPFCLYFGMTHYYEQMIANLTDFPHVLVSGATGSGKSVCMQIAISNEMYIRPSTDFYFAQLTDKQDFEIYRSCKSTKCIATTIDGVYKMFKALMNIMKQRNELFIKEGVKNILLYNQKANKKMNCIIVAIDEMPEFMPKTEKIDGKDHEYKLLIQEMMNKLVKQARNIGLFFIVGIQRPDIGDMLANMKSNFRVKLVFAQENAPSSKVVCDNDDAVGLPPREALYIVGASRKRFKTLYFTDDTTKEILKNRMDENHKLIDFDGSENQEKESDFVKKITKNDKNNEEKATKSTNKIKINKNKTQNNEAGAS